MAVFLPQYDKTIDDVLAAMNGKNWNAADYKHYMVSLSMPLIETDTNLDLKEFMASLGMKNAFLTYDGHGFMDFCYFGDNEANSDPCWISLMRQKAHLKLDQKGTEAAAATVIGISDKSMPQQMVTFHANRPFFYIISEQSTGSIFFIGQYMGEGNKTGISQMVKESSTTENPAIYDLQGRRIQGEPQKGFYIQNGKKILK